MQVTCSLYNCESEKTPNKIQSRLRSVFQVIASFNISLSLSLSLLRTWLYSSYSPLFSLSLSLSLLARLKASVNFENASFQSSSILTLCVHRTRDTCTFGEHWTFSRPLEHFFLPWLHSHPAERAFKLWLSNSIHFCSPRTHTRDKFSFPILSTYTGSSVLSLPPSLLLCVLRKRTEKLMVFPFPLDLCEISISTLHFVSHLSMHLFTLDTTVTCLSCYLHIHVTCKLLFQPSTLSLGEENSSSLSSFHSAMHAVM